MDERLVTTIISYALLFGICFLVLSQGLFWMLVINPTWRSRRRREQSPEIIEPTIADPAPTQETTPPPKEPDKRKINNSEVDFNNLDELVKFQENGLHAEAENEQISYPLDQHRAVALRIEELLKGKQ